MTDFVVFKNPRCHKSRLSFIADGPNPMACLLYFFPAKNCLIWSTTDFISSALKLTLQGRFKQRAYASSAASIPYAGQSLYIGNVWINFQMGRTWMSLGNKNSINGFFLRRGTLMEIGRAS